MVPAFAEIVAEALAKTRVPDVAAALHAGGETVFAGSVERQFRIASITKSFTATLLSQTGQLDERARALLSHTAGYRPESTESLPPECGGLWSYSNAGYWAAAARYPDYEAALHEHVLEPLGLSATGLEPRAPFALGHVQEGENGHRQVAGTAYPEWRRAGGGLWSTVGDLITYGLAHCRGFEGLHQPQAEALGASYALGWWVRDGVLDHEGSAGGYQALLMLVPDDEFVLAVLTNSWRGSGLIRRVVEALEIVPPPGNGAPAQPGRYALDDREGTVAYGRVVERERDPVTGSWIERRFPVSSDAVLMSWRTDFPREGVARIGWVALPRG
jgi:CubicO group peptidase (beta-lactamase class C family)